MAQKGKKPTTDDNEGLFSEIARKFKANPGLYIGSVVILLLVSVTFLAGDFLFRGGGGDIDLTFGYYDKVPISWLPGNRFSQYVEQLERQYRGSIDPNDFQATISLWNQAFEMTAVYTAVLQEVKRSNYEVPERIVDREVARMPQFQENGRFSPALYRQMSDTSRLTLWRQVRDELTVIQFYNDLFTLSMPESESNFISGMASDMRTFEMVSFLVDDFPNSEYLAYAVENADLFRTIHLSRIIVSSEREARRILESIGNETTTFEDAAKAQSQDGFADRGGDMGIRYTFELEREIPNNDIRERIFSLGREELSEIIQLDDSWAFFRVEDELKPADFDDETTMDRVRSYMRNFQRGLMEDWAIKQAEEFIAEVQTEGFDSAARRIGKETHVVGPLPINYGNIELFPSLELFSIPEFSRQELLDLSRNTNFWRTVFSAQLNTPSEPLVHGRNVLVFFPTEQVEADEERINEIASMYSSSLNRITEISLQPYFMNSPRMDNRFWETYFRFFLQ